MRATPTAVNLGTTLGTANYGSGTTQRTPSYDPSTNGMTVIGSVTGFGSSTGEVMGNVHLSLNAEL